MGQIRRSHHYPLEVYYGDRVRPCDEVLTIVISINKSVHDPFGGGLLRLITSGVAGCFSMAHSGGEVADSDKTTFIGVCTANKLQDVLSTPFGAGKKLAIAVAIITSV